jgi:hypothetical protein
MISQSTRVNFVMSTDKLSSSRYRCLCVFVCWCMILHFHILYTFRAYAHCRFYVEPFVMILTRSGGVINFTHSADQTQQTVYIFMVIDIHIAHCGCVIISKNCRVLCSVM